MTDGDVVYGMVLGIIAVVGFLIAWSIVNHDT